MPDLSSYTCSNCGGILNYESSQVILDCPFCGTRIDRVGYHRSDIVSQAALCLKRMEYNSAYERYKELYDKDHKDFEALRGLILSSAKIPVKDDLIYPKKLIRHDLERGISVLGKLAEDCAGYPYFGILETILNLSVEYRELINARDYNAQMTKQRLENLGKFHNPDWELKDIAASNRKNADSLDQSIKDIERKLRSACAKLKMEEARMEKPVVYSSEINNTQIDMDSRSVSNISCIKCGGQLTMDTKRSFCECLSCGVAYGTSLFFGEPNKKAKEALVNQEFSEADQRYTYMLMLDPHDFAALRGRVLCAAKWSGIRVESNISSFWVNNLRSRIEYALGNALDEDKPYFRKYLEMMDIYSGILDKDNRLKPLERQRKELLHKRENIVVDIEPNEEDRPHPVYARDAVTKTISDIDKQIDKIKADKSVYVEKVRDLCGQIKEMDLSRITDQQKG